MIVVMDIQIVYVEIIMFIVIVALNVYHKQLPLDNVKQVAVLVKRIVFAATIIAILLNGVTTALVHVIPHALILQLIVLAVLIILYALIQPDFVYLKLLQMAYAPPIVRSVKLTVSVE